MLSDRTWRHVLRDRNEQVSRFLCFCNMYWRSQYIIVLGFVGMTLSALSESLGPPWAPDDRPCDWGTGELGVRWWLNVMIDTTGICGLLAEKHACFGKMGNGDWLGWTFLHLRTQDLDGKGRRCDSTDDINMAKRSTKLKAETGISLCHLSLEWLLMKHYSYDCFFYLPYGTSYGRAWLVPAT